MKKNTGVQICAILILLLFACNSTDASNGNASLVLDNTVDLPGAGIRFRPFKGFDQTSIPSIQAYIYTNSQTGVKIESYAPVDLWKRDQQIANFQGEHGAFELAALKDLIPQELPLINKLHVIEHDYYEALGSPNIAWNEKNIRSWVEKFAGDINTMEKKIRGHYLRYNYLRFTFRELPEEEKQGLVIGKSGGRKIFILFNFAKGLSKSKIDKAIWGLLKTIMITGKRNVVTNKGRHFQNYRTNTREKKSSRFESTRKRVINEIKNLKDWWHVETKNYVIKSNLSSQNRALALLIQEDIEIMRKAYTAFLPPSKEIDEVSVVTVFRSHKEYKQYIPADYSWSGGLWMPDRKELVISPGYIGNKKVTNKEMLPTVYHEAFHQYIFYSLDYVSPPIWYNEGHSMLFETCKLDRSRKTVLIRENGPRMRVLESLINKKQIKLKEVMMLSPKEFQQKEDLSRNYTVSWALVYFFQKAGHIYKNRNYAKVCDVILQELIKTGDWKKANQKGIATINMKELNKDFLDFWADKSKRRTAEDHRLFDRRGKRVK